MFVYKRLITAATLTLIYLICFILEPYIGYQSVGLILMLPILIVSFNGNFKTVLLTGFGGALIWNFFFIPPKYHFSISLTEDKIMILTYFLVSLIMAVLTARIQNIKIIVESERLYRALFDSVSHELKTPLTAIMGSATAMCLPNISKESQIVLLEEITKASIRLENVINNLLDMSRIKSGILTPQNDIIEINSFLNDFLSRHREIFLNIDLIKIFSDQEVYIQGDEGLLENVFLNLFRNCIRHGESLNTIEIITNIENQYSIIEINDDGKGTKVSNLNKLFLPFNASKNAKGLGLGLSISKAFIESMGGSIMASHSPVKSGFLIKIKMPYFNLKESTFKNVNK